MCFNSSDGEQNVIVSLFTAITNGHALNIVGNKYVLQRYRIDNIIIAEYFFRLAIVLQQLRNDTDWGCLNQQIFKW